jgi:hypothetical protein
MKQSLWIIALLFGAAFAQPVFADTYSITLLDGSGPTVDGTGSFTYSAGVFSGFTVIWDTLTFDFTSIANSTPTEMHGCAGGVPISFFTYLTSPDCQTGGTSPPAWQGDDDGADTQTALAFAQLSNPIRVITPTIGATDGFQAGNFNLINTTPTGVPEPNSVFLMSTALLAVAFVARKHNARGLRSATRTNP